MDYYNSPLTGLSVPICLPLIHSLHSSKSNLSHKASSSSPCSYCPPVAPPCTQDKTHIVSTAHQALLMLQQLWMAHSSPQIQYDFSSLYLDFAGLSPVMPMPSLWFFGLLSPPHPLRASSTIFSEKSSLVMTHTCVRAHTHTCTYIWLHPNYTLQICHYAHHTMLPWWITGSTPLTRLSALIGKAYSIFIFIARLQALCLASSRLSINNYWSIISTSLHFKLGKFLLWWVMEFV